MRNWKLALALAVASIACMPARAQDVKKPDPPKAAPASAPEMTDAEKLAIREAQNQFMQVILQMSAAEKQYTKLLETKAAAQEKMNEAQAAVQKRIGDAWLINPDTLAVTPKPVAPPVTPAAPAPAPAPAKNPNNSREVSAMEAGGCRQG